MLPGNLGSLHGERLPLQQLLDSCQRCLVDERLQDTLRVHAEPLVSDEVGQVVLQVRPRERARHLPARGVVECYHPLVATPCGAEAYTDPVTGKVSLLGGSEVGEVVDTVAVREDEDHVVAGVAREHR